MPLTDKPASDLMFRADDSADVFAASSFPLITKQQRTMLTVHVKHNQLLAWNPHMERADAIKQTRSRIVNAKPRYKSPVWVG